MSLSTLPIRMGSRLMTLLRSAGDARGSLAISRILPALVGKLGILPM